MERVLPIDLDHAKLKRALRGYETEGVDRIIQSASRTLESLMHENASLKLQSSCLQNELEGYHAMESTLRDAIVLAQRTADETRSTAHRHADLIAEEARQSAISERAEVQRIITDLRIELDQLQQEKNRFQDDFRALLDRFRRDLPSIHLAVVQRGSADHISESAEINAVTA